MKLNQLRDVVAIALSLKELQDAEWITTSITPKAKKRDR